MFIAKMTINCFWADYKTLLYLSTNHHNIMFAAICKYLQRFFTFICNGAKQASFQKIYEKNNLSNTLITNYLLYRFCRHSPNSFN
jgi:hypothetical protein